MKTKKLITIPQPNQKALIQLICFPYAGGGKSIFFEWIKKINKNIEIHIVSLPGREDKLKDNPILDFNILFQQLKSECIQNITKPFAIFGHSMGGVLSHGLASELEKSQIFPQYLISSAAPAPIKTKMKSEDILHKLPDTKFLTTLSQRYQAIPPSVMQDKSLMQIFLPTLRADVTLLESYLISSNKNLLQDYQLNCKIIAICGDSDPECNETSIQEWRTLTKNLFYYTIFSGSHFYLHQNLNKLLNLIENLTLKNIPI